MSCQTVLGKIAIVLFILVGLVTLLIVFVFHQNKICTPQAMFASSVPEIIELIGTHSKYEGSYKKKARRRWYWIIRKSIIFHSTTRHIIVCGNISYETASNFLKDFLHEDRENVDVEVVFLHSALPDLNLERLLKKRHTKVKYFQGSLMNSIDMDRVKV